MIVYQTDSNGVFVGLSEADPSPLEPGEWIIPGGCVTVPPPTPPVGSVAVWVNGAWTVVPIEVSEQVATAQTPDEIVAMYSRAVDARVESRAKELGYNGAAHLASYVTSTVSDWATEAQSFVVWRDQVWLYAVAVYETAQLDPQTLPSLETFMTDLPQP